jgi:septin family protein
VVFLIKITWKMVATNIETRKMALISFIITLKEDKAIAAFERVVPSVEKTVTPNENGQTDALNLAHYVSTTRESVTIEELMREQQFTVFDREGFDQIVKNLAIQEPIEKLLAQLTP